MTLDKFVMRGFSGSLGSGEGRWVATSTQPQQSAARSSGDTGTSFVLGGGGLRGRPQGNSNKDGKQYREDRYSFDADEIRNKGSVKELKDHKECLKFTSVADALSTKRGHQVLVGIAMYGAALIVGIVLLYAYFGSGESDGYYVPPPGMNRNARPLWDR